MSADVRPLSLGSAGLTDLRHVTARLQELARPRSRAFSASAGHSRHDAMLSAILAATFMIRFASK